MTLTETGADLLISQFGVTVEVYPQSEQEPEDSSNPVFFSDTDNSSNFTEYKVRLYSSASDEMMRDYGFDEASEAIMYSTDDIAGEGDKVVYPDDSQTWIVQERTTNQIDDSQGPYIFAYSMRNT